MIELRCFCSCNSLPQTKAHQKKKTTTEIFERNKKPIWLSCVPHCFLSFRSFIYLFFDIAQGHRTLWIQFALYFDIIISHYHHRRPLFSIFQSHSIPIDFLFFFIIFFLWTERKSESERKHHLIYIYMHSQVGVCVRACEWNFTDRNEN